MGKFSTYNKGTVDISGGTKTKKKGKLTVIKEPTVYWER